MPKKKTDAQIEREIDEVLNAKKHLFIGTMATGISYADRSREKHGDYMTIARLPFSTLKLEWSPGRHSQALRDLVAEHAAKIIAREGEEYPVSSSGQTITLGHGKRNSHLSKLEIGDAVQFRWEPGTGGVIRRLAGELALVATSRGDRRVPIDALVRVRKDHEARVRRSAERK